MSQIRKTTCLFKYTGPVYAVCVTTFNKTDHALICILEFANAAENWHADTVLSPLDRFFWWAAASSAEHCHPQDKWWGGGGKGEATERGQRTRKIGNQGDIKLGKREGVSLLVNLPPVHQLLLTH